MGRIPHPATYSARFFRDRYWPESISDEPGLAWIRLPGALAWTAH
jgi:hypothetical protein